MKSCTILLLLAGVGAAAPLENQPLKRVAITHVTVIDAVSDVSKPDMTILIEGNRIAAITPADQFGLPAGAQVIDGTRKFVIPGLTDMHNHGAEGTLNPFASPKVLRQVLACGVTTIFCPGATSRDFIAFKHAAADPNAPLARYYSAGKVFSVRGGHDPSRGQASFYPVTTEEARANVRQQKATGVDAIKFIVDSTSDRRTQPLPVLDPEILKAVIDEAHRQGLKAYGHAPQLRYARQSIAAGADGLLHGILDEPVDDELIALMKKKHAIYVTTLTLYYDIADVVGFSRRLQAMDERGVHSKATYGLFQRDDTAASLAQRFGDKSAAECTKNLPVARANVKKVWDNGVLVAAGTDTGVPGVLSGVASQMELVLLVDSGLTPMEAIRAGTINGQKILGQEKEFGSVEAGKVADLVVLDADPLTDIRNISKVYRVVKNGTVFDPVDLLVEPTPTAK